MIVLLNSFSLASASSLVSAVSLADPFGGELTRLAALELIVLGVTCGALGAWVLQLGRAFLTESLTHALLPGLVVGAGTGLGLAAGAALGTAAAFGATAAAERAPRATPSTATSVAVTTLVGGGALLATQIEGAGLLERLLFGDPLGIDGGDITAGALLALFVLGALWLLRRPLAAYAFEPESVAGIGLNRFALEWTFLGLLSVTVAASAFIAGSLLAPALMIAPALGLRAAHVRAPHAPLYAGLLGGFCGLLGVYVSYLADLPVSATVALCCCATALLLALAGATWPKARRRPQPSRD